MGLIFNQADCKITSGTSLSAAVQIGAGQLAAIRMPSGWDAASLTFQASDDDVNFANVYDDGGNEYTVTVSTSRHVVVDPSMFLGALTVKVRSGTSGSAVNQTADRTLTLITRRDRNS